MVKIFEEINKTPLFLKILAILILLIRLFLFLQPSFKIDMGDWQGWAIRLIQVGPLNFYSPQSFADYLPFFYLLLWLSGEALILLFGKGVLLSSLFPFYIKFISTLFDFATALVIFAIVKKHSSKWAGVAAIIYLINPGTIFVNSVWGQVDSIPTFFLVFSLYFFYEKSNIKAWSISNTLSFLIKPLNASILPITIVSSIKNFSLKENLKGLILAVFLWYAISIPFFLNDPIGGVFNLLGKSLSVYPYASINAYNLWGLFGWWKPDTALFFGASLHTLGFIFYALILLVILSPYFKGKIKKIKGIDYFACMLSSFGFFLFLTRMHERTLFPFFALLVIVIFIERSRFLLISYIILSLIYLIDIFYSYYYYNFVFDNSLLSHNLLFQVAGDYRVAFSAINLLIFGMMLILYLRKAYFKNKSER